MSDDEYEYEYGSDVEYDYGSDGGDQNEENGENDELIELENAFYEGDDLQNDNPTKAIEMFEKVVELEEKLGDQIKWRFKALQSLVKLYFSVGSYEKMTDRYRAMLRYISSVTRNECTDAINAILDTLNSTIDSHVLAEMYEITLLALKSANNERLWFNTNLKLAKLYLEDQRFQELNELIDVLKAACMRADGTEDPTKSSILLEIYCLEIKFCSLTLDKNRLKNIYSRTMNFQGTVSDPRILGTIHEEGGKMQMSDQNYDEAYLELYEAFRNYQEAGNIRAKDCLKYVVLASMLTSNNINPFAAREAKVYSDDKEIMAMSDLRVCLETNDLAKFERTVTNRANRILDEPFLMKYIDVVRKRIREKVLLNLVQPYHRVSATFLAKELNLSVDHVEHILCELIVSGQLSASINKITGEIALNSFASKSARPLR